MLRTELVKQLSASNKTIQRNQKSLRPQSKMTRISRVKEECWETKRSRKSARSTLWNAMKSIRSDLSSGRCARWVSSGCRHRKTTRRRLQMLLMAFLRENLWRLQDRSIHQLGNKLPKRTQQANLRKKELQFPTLSSTAPSCPAHCHISTSVFLSLRVSFS